MRVIPKEWDATGRTFRREAEEMDRKPTAQEIDEILAPWRSLRWREAAFYIWKDRDDEAIWLRTHYDSEQDAKFHEWREIDEDCDPRFDQDLVPWCVLDDAEMFDFGDDWQKVFEVLPELLGPVWQGYKRGIDENNEYVQKARATIREAEDQKTEAETGSAGEELQYQAVTSFLIVADSEAFKVDRLRYLFLDGYGNIVRHSRIRPDQSSETRGEWDVGKFRDGQWWRIEWEEDEDSYRRTHNEPGGILGEKYRAGGELGRVLYGFD